jgi:EpsD family peptidyl-prolyl cis-trans isomerase
LRLANLQEPWFMINLRSPSRSLLPLAWAVAAAVAALAAGCSESQKEKPATQTAAKVNKEEITVHQINGVLSQQRNLRPEQADEAGRRVLERLIDQELAVQKAAELKLDRDPSVLQRLQASRREIIASAYADKLGEGAPRPSAVEIKKYYDEHPALFSQRKIYQLQELTIQAEPAQVEALRPKLAAAKSLNDFIEHLKANNIKSSGNQVLRAAEQVPLAVLPQLAAMKDSSALINPTPTGATVLYLAASRSQPVELDRASRAIEQYLFNERKRTVIADDRKALRAGAKIEYVGAYAASAPQAEPVKALSPAEVAASAAAAMDLKSVSVGLGLKGDARSSSAAEAAGAGVKPASAVDAAAISKGLGLK